MRIFCLFRCLSENLINELILQTLNKIFNVKIIYLKTFPTILFCHAELQKFGAGKIKCHKVQGQKYGNNIHSLGEDLKGHKEIKSLKKLSVRHEKWGVFQF